MSNLFQDIRAEFSVTYHASYDVYYLLMKNGITGVKIPLMSSQAKPEVMITERWLDKVSFKGSPVSDDLILSELLQIPQRRFTEKGISLLKMLCDRTGKRYNEKYHNYYPAGTVPMFYKEESEDQVDSFGIGQPGRRSTKPWEPDVPDPSVDLLKSIRDTCDRSRL